MKDDKSELSGTCLECGKHYSGWVLKEPRYQICVKCGSILQVRENGILINEPNFCFETLGYRFASEGKNRYSAIWN